MKTVKMRHPKHNGIYNAPQSAVPFWQKGGWELVDGDTATAGGVGKPVQQQAALPASPADEVEESTTSAPAARRTAKKES